MIRRGLHLPLVYVIMVLICLILAIGVILFTKSWMREISTVHSQAVKYSQQISEVLEKESNKIVILKNKYTDQHIVDKILENLQEIKAEIKVHNIEDLTTSDIADASLVILISSPFRFDIIYAAYPKNYLIVDPKNVKGIIYTNNVRFTPSYIRIPRGEYLLIPTPLDNYELHITLSSSTSGIVHIDYSVLNSYEYLGKTPPVTISDLGPRISITVNNYNSVQASKEVYGTSGYCTSETLSSITKSLPYTYNDPIMFVKQGTNSVLEVRGDKLLFVQDRQVYAHCTGNTGIQPYLLGGIAIYGDNVYVKKIKVVLRTPLEDIQSLVPMKYSPDISTTADIVFIPYYSSKVSEIPIESLKATGTIIIAYDCENVDSSSTYVTYVKFRDTVKKGTFPMVVYSPLGVEYDVVVHTSSGPALVVLRTTPPVICMSPTLQKVLSKQELAIVIRDAIITALRYKEIGYVEQSVWSRVLSILQSSKRILVLTDATFSPFPDLVKGKCKDVVNVQVVDSEYTGKISIPVLKRAIVLYGNEECPLVQEVRRGTKWFVTTYNVIENKEAFLAVVYGILKR